MYQVIITKPAEKRFKKLDKRFQNKVLESLRGLRSNPLIGVKMSGEFQGSYKIKIPPMRIIYAPDHKNKTILVMAIGHRQGIYK